MSNMSIECENEVQKRPFLVVGCETAKSFHTFKKIINNIRLLPIHLKGTILLKV
jgi:hypothetical protein